MNPQQWAILSIGSNMGDSMDNCQKGIQAIAASDGITIEKISPFYWTEPVDYTDQQWFLNAALKIRTSLAPISLLDILQSIQKAAGRKLGGIRFGPRVLDLDIIFFEEMIFTHERLEIPHPRMHKRLFVLQPICDIEPDVRHPVLGLSAFQLLNQLDKDGQGIKPCCFD